jgi:acyl carrier protein
LSGFGRVWLCRSRSAWDIVSFRSTTGGLMSRWFPCWRTANVASVAERVIDIVAEQLGVDKEKITPETSFVNDLGADSLDTVELVMELEEEFDINIPDDAAEKIQTVGQAIKFIEEAQNA